MPVVNLPQAAAQWHNGYRVVIRGERERLCNWAGRKVEEMVVQTLALIQHASVGVVIIARAWRHFFARRLADAVAGNPRSSARPGPHWAHVGGESAFSGLGTVEASPRH